MATAVIANEVEIKQAMQTLRLDNWVDDLIDEIELQNQLRASVAQADRGELIPTSEVKKEIGRLFAKT